MCNRRYSSADFGEKNKNTDIIYKKNGLTATLSRGETVFTNDFLRCSFEEAIKHIQMLF